MAGPRDDEMAVRAVVLAQSVGHEEAAKAFGVSVRTIWRWKAAVKADSRLTEVVRAKKKEIAESLDERLRSCFGAAIGKLEELIATADPSQIRDVAGAMKLVGDQINTRAVVGIRDAPAATPAAVTSTDEATGSDGRLPGGDQPSQEAAETGGGDGAIPIRGLRRVSAG